MNVWRFLTKRDIELSFIQGFVLILCITGPIVFLDTYRDEKRERDKEARYQQRIDEARAEIRVLKAAAAKRNGTAQSTTASLKVSSETDPQTPAVHAPDDSDVSISDDTVEIVHTGPLKGLPLDLAKEIHKEYTDASIARAKRYHEWDLRRRDYKEREEALFEKELAHGDALLANSKKFGETYLASFALMSPEALETARKELLKTQPAEEVDSFFTKVKAYGTSKSREQINQEVQDYKEPRETLAELKAEREQLQREEEELQRTKPLPPNLGLDEFYTEWKERNSSKPTPP
ncbi:hypothetical protein J5I95_00835 [Candidatus Poribacteria bacterium]|nr:hypothetical protein [Candidatus Poribacteria bacterium]